MKIINTMLAFLLLTGVSGKEFPQKEGCIEIKKINHYFFHNKKGDQTKRTSNKANRPYLIIYLDSFGNIIERAGYGKYHNMDLRILDFVEQNEYENGKLIQSIKYETDYENNISACFKTKYFYNYANQLIQEKESYYKTDSMYRQIDYEYDMIGNKTKTKTIYNPTYYYQRTFDNQSRIISLQQIYNSKLRWEWTFEYSDTTRIGEFRTYYNDGKDYTKKEICKYKNGNLIEVEEKYASKEGLSSKTVFHYNKSGLIKRIDFFEAYSSKLIYEHIGFTEIKIKFCKQLTSEIIKKINITIYDE